MSTDGAQNPMDLDELIELARIADPATRIEYRDRISSYGAMATPRMTEWVMDARLGAFAVRVLERVAGQPGQRAAVLGAFRSVAERLPTPAVARDVADVTQRLEGQIQQELIQRESAAMAAARELADQKRRAILDSLARDRAARVTEATVWLNSQPVSGADLLRAVDGERLTSFLDQLDVVRRTAGLAGLSGARRHDAATTWLRGRLLPDDEKRVSLCWRCHSTVFSDLNPQCPACYWMVCLCDACRDPRRPKGACDRMRSQGFELEELTIL